MGQKSDTVFLGLMLQRFSQATIGVVARFSFEGSTGEESPVVVVGRIHFRIAVKVRLFLAGYWHEATQSLPHRPHYNNFFIKANKPRRQ